MAYLTILSVAPTMMSTSEYLPRKDEKESGSGVISYDIPDLLGNTEEKHDIFKDNQCLGRDSNRLPPK